MRYRQYLKEISSEYSWYIRRNPDYGEITRYTHGILMIYQLSFGYTGEISFVGEIDDLYQRGIELS